MTGNLINYSKDYMNIRTKARYDIGDYVYVPINFIKANNESNGIFQSEDDKNLIYNMFSSEMHKFDINNLLIMRIDNIVIKYSIKEKRNKVWFVGYLYNKTSVEDIDNRRLMQLTLGKVKISQKYVVGYRQLSTIKHMMNRENSSTVYKSIVDKIGLPNKINVAIPEKVALSSRYKDEIKKRFNNKPVEIRVKDHGIMIDQDYCKTITKMFVKIAIKSENETINRVEYIDIK